MATLGVVLSLLRLVNSQVYLGGTYVEIPSGLSSQCSAPLNETVKCSGLLSYIASGYYPTDSELDLTCTSDCLASLQSVRDEQLQQCTSTDTITTAGQTYPPTLALDSLIFTYNTVCLKDSSTGNSSMSGYCLPLIDSWFNESSTGYLTAAQNCSDCYLHTLQVHLDSNFGYDEDLAAEFASLTSSCGKSNYPTTSPAPYLLPGNTSATPTSASATTTSVPCSGMYTIQAGDDCKSISKSHNVSTNSLLLQNNLGAYCVGFPDAGTQLCLPPSCDVYTVQANDTCYGIASSLGHKFTATQLNSWNPNINRGCSNMDQLVGYEICVSNPNPYTGFQTTGNGVNPTEATTTAPIPTDVVSGTNVNCSKYYHVSPGDTCSSITVMEGIGLQDFYFLNPEINSTDCSNLFAGYSYCVRAVGDITTYSGYGGASSSQQFSCVTSGTLAASCINPSPTTDTYWSAPFDDPTTTNSIASSTAATAQTTATSLPVATGTSDDCSSYVEYITPKKNRTLNANSCYFVANFIGITPEQFVNINPSLSYDSKNASACVLAQGYRYCAVPGSANATATAAPPPVTTNPAATPTPTQAGMVSGCMAFYLVKAGDTCYDIAQTAKISLDDFYSYNPAVKSDCSGLESGYYVCVGTGPASTSSQPMTTTTPTNGVSTPTPTQTGMTTSCNKFHDVVSGDTCYDIAQSASIALSDFYSYNPAVGTDCSGLIQGYYVCIGNLNPPSTTTSPPATTTAGNGVATPSPIQSGMVTNCKTFHDAVSGDGCYDIAQAASISLDDFYKWNPALNGDCSGLYLGYYYCIGLLS